MLNSSITTMCNDCIYEICNYLQTQALLRFSQTSKGIYNLVVKSNLTTSFGDVHLGREYDPAINYIPIIGKAINKNKLYRVTSTVYYDEVFSNFSVMYNLLVTRKFELEIHNKNIPFRSISVLMPQFKCSIVTELYNRMFNPKFVGSSYNSVSKKKEVYNSSSEEKALPGHIPIARKCIPISREQIICKRNYSESGSNERSSEEETSSDENMPARKCVPISRDQIICKRDYSESSSNERSSEEETSSEERTSSEEETSSDENKPVRKYVPVPCKRTLYKQNCSKSSSGKSCSNKKTHWSKDFSRTCIYNPFYSIQLPLNTVKRSIFYPNLPSIISIDSSFSNSGYRRLHKNIIFLNIRCVLKSPNRDTSIVLKKALTFSEFEDEISNMGNVVIFTSLQQGLALIEKYDNKEDLNALIPKRSNTIVTTRNDRNKTIPKFINNIVIIGCASEDMYRNIFYNYNINSIPVTAYIGNINEALIASIKVSILADFQSNFKTKKSKNGKCWSNILTLESTQEERVAVIYTKKSYKNVSAKWILGKGLKTFTLAEFLDFFSN